MTAAAAPTPDPVDFIDVAGLLSDEERLVRDTVRAYVQARVLPNVADWFEEGILPRELGPELGRLGLLGMHLERLRLRRRERGCVRPRMFGT